MAVNTEVNSVKWKSVLRDLYDSEELRIKSNRSKVTRTLLDELCTARLDDPILCLFDKCYTIVETDIERLKKEAASTKEEKPYFKRMFHYQAKSLPTVIQVLPDKLKDPVMWQVLCFGVAIATSVGHCCSH